MCNSISYLVYMYCTCWILLIRHLWFVQCGFFFLIAFGLLSSAILNWSMGGVIVVMCVCVCMSTCVITT